MFSFSAIQFVLTSNCCNMKVPVGNSFSSQSKWERFKAITEAEFPQKEIFKFSNSPNLQIELHNSLFDAGSSFVLIADRIRSDSEGLPTALTKC